MAYGIWNGSSLIAKFVVPMRLLSNKPVFVSDTLSLKRQVATRTAQRWEIITGLEPLSDGANELYVNMVVAGYGGTVSVVTPQNIGVIRARTHGSSQLATGSIGATQVTFSAGTGFMPKGTMLKFANHAKIYMSTSDLTGNGVVNIYPALISAVPLSTAVASHDEVIMTCLYDTDTVSGMAFSDGILMDVASLKLVEQL
jgi:hypothetical protein